MRFVRLAGFAAFGLLIGCAPAAVSLEPADLSRAVMIERDTNGVPHIRASSEEAAAFGFGYAQAEDHAEELARRLIAGRGEAAKYFGDAGVDNDLAIARFDNVEASRRALDEVGPVYRRMLEAFAAGVNLYVAQHRDTLPPWIPVFTAADIQAGARSGAAVSLAGDAIAQRLERRYSNDPERRVEGSPEPLIDQPGSNAFALAGSRTTTGKPILMGNPHLAWSSRYWEAHVIVPGKINFYGSTLVGIPVLRAGFNDRIGFVQTNNAPDLDDVYALTLTGGDRYQFDGAAHRLEPFDVSIEVRNADGTFRRETRTYWRSHIGPVVHRTTDRAYVVRSMRLESPRYYEGFYHASKARNLRGFMDAMSRAHVPTSNFTYADADGNILYLWNARLPRRVQANGDYSLDVPADSSRVFWQGLHPLADLPQLLNPRGGYVQNANNPPWFASRRDPLDEARHPRYVERGTLALRPQLAVELLESRDRFSVDDVVALKYDTRLLLADRVKPALVRALEGASLSADGAAGLAALKAWDNRASASSRGTALFLRFWDLYVGRVRQPYATPWDATRPWATPEGLADAAEAVTQFEVAARAIRDAHGRVDVAWGDISRFRAGDLDLPGEGAPGTYGAYRVTRFDAVPGSAQRVAGNVGGDLVGFGDAWVLVVDFSAPVKGHSVLAYGQTSDPASPHSRDQLRTFAERKVRRAWFTDDEIRANLERRYAPGR